MLHIVLQVFIPEAGDRSDVPNFAILITGGLLFSEFTLPLAYHAQEQGVHVFGIGIGLSTSDKLELNMIASDPDELNVYNQPDVARLNEIVDKIVATLCEGTTQISLHTGLSISYTR